jgi:hypothetical protein
MVLLHDTCYAAKKSHIRFLQRVFIVVSGNMWTLNLYSYMA